MDFEGAWTALVTPFTRDGARIDFDRLEANVDAQAEGGVAGVVPCGTTGESPTLTEAEHAQVVERTIEAARRCGRRVIAGAGSNCTRRAIELHRAAERAGADASLQVVPYYNRPSQRGLERHFLAIADACDLPVVLYNIPSRCGAGLAVETIERLAGTRTSRR
jgi:4-hydroxy-tetrahydrodipicolinate synthase